MSTARTKSARVYKKGPAQRKPVRVKKQVRSLVKNKTLHLSGCAQEYLESLLLPFDAAPACIPSFFPLASEKQKIVTRTQFNLGTAGYGYCMVSCNASSDQNAIITTKSTSVGTSATALNAFTFLNNVKCEKNPYIANDFTTNAVAARCVSMGLRIRYLGRQDAQAGLVTLYESPDHLEMGPITFGNISSYDEAKKERVGNDYHQINYSGPIMPSDIEYANTPTPLGTTYFMCILIQGEIGAAYEAEFVQNFEYIGTVVHAKTESHSDVAAYGVIQSAVKSAAKNSPLQPSDTESVLSKVAHGLIENAPQIANVAKGIYDAGHAAVGLLTLDPKTILYEIAKGFTARSPVPSLMNSPSGGGSMSMNDPGYRSWNAIFG